MPKINVYLPDELAEAVKESGLPVSAICQRALEQSVRRVSAIRSTVLGDLRTEDPTARLPQFTERARSVIKLGIEQARSDGAPEVGTEHLLYGVLAEGTNLALHVLRAVEVEPEQLARDLGSASSTSDVESAAARFRAAAANALELTVTEAIALGHNYVGCEHLLLGLIGEPDGTAGQVLRAHGAELRTTRRAVVAALAGYVHLRAQAAPIGPAPLDPARVVATTVRSELQPVISRLERLEQHLGLAAGD